MDEIIRTKTHHFDDIITDLAENYSSIFWEQVEELYSHVNYEERSALVWKANEKQNYFLTTI